jgi:hypothetical protein
MVIAVAEIQTRELPNMPQATHVTFRLASSGGVLLEQSDMLVEKYKISHCVECPKRPTKWGMFPVLHGPKSEYSATYDPDIVS